MRLVVLIVVTITCTASSTKPARSTSGNNKTSIGSLPNVDSREVLYVLVTGPYPDPLDDGWDGAIPLIPAVRLAFNQINTRIDILQDYRLQAIEDDSGCAVGTKAINSLFSKAFYSAKQIVGIIGPACSGPTLAIAPTLAHSEVSLIQIAPTATSPLIATHSYNTTFTMIASALRVIDSFTALMIHNNWTKVVTLYDADRIVFRTTNDKFIERIESMESFEVAYSVHVVDSLGRLAPLFLPLEEVVKSRTRVIVLFMETRTVKKVICLAFHMNMCYPNYQWVLTDQTKNDLESPFDPFHYQGVRYNCSREMMATALNGVVLNRQKLHQDDDTLLSPMNLSYKEYRDGYDKEFWKYWEEPKVQKLLALTAKERKNFLPSGYWENAYYDAAWALGVALDTTSNGGLNLSQYSYGEPEVTKILADNLQNIRMEGATGPLMFGTTKSIQTTIVTSQLRTSQDSVLTESIIAYYSKNKLHFLNQSNATFIHDTFRQIPIRVHLALGIFIIVITFMVMIFIVLLQIAFIAWHNRKSLKASSPNISHLIFSGCYLFASATILHSIQQSFELDHAIMEWFHSILCNIIMWCLLLGYSLIFGTVFVKVWRVFRIFNHFRNRSPGVCLSDNALIIAVIGLLVVDTIILFIWNTLYPWLTVKTDSHYELMDGEPTIFVTLSCRCTNMFYLIGVVAVYKGIIAILLLVFSILNRKIRRKNFNYTKKVNIFVYSVTMLSGVGFPLYFILFTTNIHVLFLVLCAILMLIVVMCCLMLFLPPVLPVVKTKLGIREGNNKKHTLQSVQYIHNLVLLSIDST